MMWRQPGASRAAIEPLRGCAALGDGYAVPLRGGPLTTRLAVWWAVAHQTPLSALTRLHPAIAGSAEPVPAQDGKRPYRGAARDRHEGERSDALGQIERRARQRAKRGGQAALAAGFKGAPFGTADVYTSVACLIARRDFIAMSH